MPWSTRRPGRWRLATRLIRSPEDLAPVLSSLLPGAQLAWRAEPPDGHADNANELWLTDPAGGGYLLSRPMAPFTPAECARAYAMIDVATIAQAHLVPAAGTQGGSGDAPVGGPDELRRLLLADGREVVVRRATPDDVAAVADLSVRCSLDLPAAPLPGRTARARARPRWPACSPPTPATRWSSRTRSAGWSHGQPALGAINPSSLCWSRTAGSANASGRPWPDGWSRRPTGPASARSGRSCRSGARRWCGS